jgi:hypothetical protein
MSRGCSGRSGSRAVGAGSSSGRSLPLILVPLTSPRRFIEVIDRAMPRSPPASPAWYPHDHSLEESKRHHRKDDEIHAQVPFPVNPSCTACLICRLQVSDADVQSRKSRSLVANVRVARGSNWYRQGRTLKCCLAQTRANSPTRSSRVRGEGYSSKS